VDTEPLRVHAARMALQDAEVALTLALLVDETRDPFGPVLLDGSPPVLAAQPWPTNAHLIADCARLGYICKDSLTLDPTYGRGTWWSIWRPDRLVWYKDTIDFRDIPHPDGTFDVIAYDPPFVSAGGRSTTGLPNMHDHYGMRDAPRTPAALQGLMNKGFEECVRVVKPGGLVLFKCQDYISSGKLWPGTFLTQFHALHLNLEMVDRMEMVTKPRPQPQRKRQDGSHSTQQHARRNLSTLLVFRRPK